MVPARDFARHKGDTICDLLIDSQTGWQSHLCSRSRSIFTNHIRKRVEHQPIAIDRTTFSLSVGSPRTAPMKQDDQATGDDGATI